MQPCSRLRALPEREESEQIGRQLTMTPAEKSIARLLGSSSGGKIEPRIGRRIETGLVVRIETRGRMIEQRIEKRRISLGAHASCVRGGQNRASWLLPCSVIQKCSLGLHASCVRGGQNRASWLLPCSVIQK
jgi:hypothetical protein